MITAIFMTLFAVSSAVRADDLSLDAKRMLSYGTTAVEVGACKFPITEAEQKQMMDSLSKYAELQKDLTQEQFTDAMKTAGAQIGANKDAICAEVGKQTIAQLLADDENGK